MRYDVYYVKSTNNGIMAATGPDLVFSRSDAQHPASPLERPNAPSHGQSRHQDIHRFRRTALSQQDPWIAVHRCWRIRRCNDVVLSMRQAQAAQPAEVASFVGQSAVRLLAQLQGSRRRKHRQALSLTWCLSDHPGASPWPRLANCNVLRMNPRQR